MNLFLAGISNLQSLCATQKECKGEMGDRRDTADESGISPTRGRFISPSKGRPYIGHGTAVFFLNGKSLHPIRMNILELRR